jgi:hypothetical protein
LIVIGVIGEIQPSALLAATVANEPGGTINTPVVFVKVIPFTL